MTVIVETKRPQLIFTSDPFPTTEEVIKPAAAQPNSASPNPRLRRLSTVNAMHRKMAKTILLSKHENAMLPSAMKSERPGAFTMLSRSRTSSETEDMTSRGSNLPSAMVKGEAENSFSALSRSRHASVIVEEHDEQDEAVAVMNEFGLAPTSFIDLVKVARHNSKIQTSPSSRPSIDDSAAAAKVNSMVPFSPSAMLAAGVEEDDQSESSDSSDEDGDDTHNCYGGNGGSDEKHKAAAEALMQAFGQPTKKGPPQSRMNTIDEVNQHSSVRKKLSDSLEMSKSIDRSLSQDDDNLEGNHLAATLFQPPLKVSMLNQCSICPDVVQVSSRPARISGRRTRTRPCRISCVACALPSVKWG